MKAINCTVLAILLLSITNISFAQRDKEGSYLAPGGNTVVNSYTYLIANAAAGANTITVNDGVMVGGVFSGILAAGDLLMVIQMQGASMDINTLPTTGWGSNYTVPNSYVLPDLTNFGVNPHEFGGVTNYNQSGLHERVEVLSVAGGIITLNCNLTNTYTASGHVQVIRIPRFIDLTVNAGSTIIPTLWDGNSGGVVALEVNGTLTVNAGGSISANAYGFRAGQLDPDSYGETLDTAPVRFLGSNDYWEGSEKGEGVGGYYLEYDVLESRYGIGAAANGGGGGGYQNTGGGGGSNVMVGGTYSGKGNPIGVPAVWDLELAGFGGSTSPGGGRGGYAISNVDMDATLLGPRQTAWGGDRRKTNGGFGGHPLPFVADRIWFGGGGGAGDRDSDEGGAGGRGGGIIFMNLYGAIAGAGTIEANGEAGQDSDPLGTGATAGNPISGEDGAGGGGAGGTIHIENTSAFPAGMFMNVIGGAGGNQNLANILAAPDAEAAGPGGSGSGGYIRITSGAPTLNLSAGINGVTSSSQMTEFPANGATEGSDGWPALPANPAFNITAADVTICSGATANLTAVLAGAPLGTVTWFDAMVGGTIAGTGNSLTTPALFVTTTYWVGVCPGSFRQPVIVNVLPADDASFSYASATYCITDVDPTPTITGEAGGTFTAPAALIINAGTGVIDVSASTIGGPYTITYTTTAPCANSSTFDVTITAADDASFSYASATYCTSDVDPTPTITGEAGGTFTAPGGLIINAGTGVIDLSASTIGGPYTVTYTTTAPCANSSTFDVTITAADDASFSYASATYCTSDVDPTPTITGEAGGTFTAPGGLIINAGTGVIDVSASTIGGPYTVTYTTTAPCANSSTFDVTITALDDASFSYASATYCTSDVDPTPTITGEAGGTFTAPAALIINAGTGVIDVSASTIGGPYTITYTTNAPCANSSTFDVTITALDDASFSYAAATYCTSDVDPTPTITGEVGGTFTAPAALIINAGTGVIDVSASAIGGPYTITYTTNAPCANSSTFDVTITAADDASFSYAAGTYCTSDVDPTPTITGEAGGIFSTPGGLIINAATGVIDVSASTIGGPYTVTYTTTAPCANSSTFDVTITALDDASFSYASATYCTNGIDPTPTITGEAGGTFTAPGGLIINAGTGLIDVSASTIGGPYTVTYTTTAPCANSSTFDVTITALDDASFTYPAASYCVAGTDPMPAITGLAGGTFTSLPAGLTINSISGIVDLSLSTPAAYTITYTTAGPCPSSSSVPMTIAVLDDASFSYGSPAYCVNATDPLPTITGLGGGTFSSLPAGLVINATTGSVDLSASTPATYVITYTTAGSCPNSSNVGLTVDALDDASFSYASPTYCLTAADPTPAVSGLAGGIFSSAPAGLIINAATGVIDVSASGVAVYTVTYTTSGLCPNLSSVSVEILAADNVAFTTTPSCDGGSSSVPVTAGGTFTFTVAPIDGASIDPLTGLVTGGTSGTTYNVTYTTLGACGASFSQPLTALLSPLITPVADLMACDSYALPAIVGTNLSGNEGYFDNSQAAGGVLITGPITSTQTIYMYDISGAGCSNETSYTVTITISDDASFILTDFCDGFANGAASIAVLGGSFAFNPAVIDGALVDVASGEVTNGVPGTTYTIEYTTAGMCPSNSTQQVTIFAIPLAPFVSADQTYCSSATFEAMTATGGTGTFNWYDGIGLSSADSIGTGGTFVPFNVVGVTTYYVNETENGCVGPESAIIITVNDCEVIVPTAFTPDGDGANDDWELVNIDIVFPDNIVKVYNRWGNLIFESVQGDYDNNRWDGTFKGNLLPVASYFYIIETNTEGVDAMSGSISIILN